MKILIKDTEIQIGDRVIEYYPYYFGILDYDQDHRECVKSVLSQWATALRQLGSQDEILHLPYSLDDEWVWCFRATVVDGKIALRCVQVSANGYAMNLDDLTEDMRSDYIYHQEMFQDFGIYEPNELITSFAEAEVAT